MSLPTATSIAQAPIRTPGAAIAIWKTKTSKGFGAPNQVLGDRYCSLPPTSRIARRLRGEGITTEPPVLRDDCNSGITPDLSALQARKRAWIESEPLWKTRLGDSWRGAKVLGAGSFGVAGLWTRVDTNTFEDGKRIKHVVVKQSKASPAAVRAMRGEAEIMQLFTSVETNHIVKIYRKFIVEPVQGQVDPTVGGTGNFVARIFIEYCEGGDMSQFLKTLKRKFSAENPIPEELVWHIFRCLVLGLVAMEHGNELLEGERWKEKVLHNDIKPANILISNNDNQHLKTPVVKFADFGVSRILPEKQSIQWIQEQFFTPHYRAPELVQAETKYPSYSIRRSSTSSSDDLALPDAIYDTNIKLGAHTNIWAIGKVIYNLINRSHSFSNNAPIFYFGHPGPPQKIIRTQGEAIIDAPYGAALRRAVMRCLAVNWRDRPTPREMLGICEDVLKKIEKAPEGVRAGEGVGLGKGLDEGLTFYPEPGDSQLL
ncbi:uncharacterized protein RAG0_00076 [Rhynchosporium agropyri]|uniref:non-specific serine/threonine protein kinase n=1 Tax=Rhynchosporium agropyri TaxID=914238 RepID=A0A1E1JRQ8_9HELO|nr:uncharacterized protein RAG0_00076 [Rhynchosporium agropyri]